jgi:acyl-CoA thioester hydrolase
MGGDSTRQPNSGSSEVEVEITVRFGDTDPYGVIYFVSYFRYCHHGIEEFLRHHGLPPHEFFRNRTEGFGLPIVSASCDFLKPVKYGEQLRLFVSVSGIKDKSLSFGFRFHVQGREEVVARGEATMVAIGRDWRARTLPDRIREAFSAVERQ